MTSRHQLATAVLAAAASAAGLGLLAGPAAAATPGGSSSSTGSACDKTAWEAKVQGKPADFKAGSPSGDYLWHDANGFHLRVTHAQHDQRIYSGTIHSPKKLSMEPVKLEKGDTAKLSKNRHTIVFVFADHGYVDGLDFHTDCAAKLTVSHLHIGNRDLGRKQVYLGAKGEHPKHVPFTVHRIPVTTPPTTT